MWAGSSGAAPIGVANDHAQIMVPTPRKAQTKTMAVRGSPAPEVAGSRRETIAPHDAPFGTSRQSDKRRNGWHTDRCGLVLHQVEEPPTTPGRHGESADVLTSKTQELRGSGLASKARRGLRRRAPGALGMATAASAAKPAITSVPVRILVVDAELVVHRSIGRYPPSRDLRRDARPVRQRGAPVPDSDPPGSDHPHGPRAANRILAADKSDVLHP